MVAMMSAYKARYRYFARCICGIPRVRLLGTPDDWRRLRWKAAVMTNDGVKDEFMGWWQPALLPILDQMAAAADGSPDADFWRGICQTTETYGSRVVGGWVTRLFPYAVGRDRSARNPMVVGWGDPACPKPTIERVKTHPDGRTVYDAETGDVVQEAVEVDGLWPHMVPQGLSCADVSLVDETVSPHGEHQFRLVGGLVGIEVDDGFMRPRAGWAAARVGKT